LMPWSRSKSATRRARFSSIAPRYVPSSTVRARIRGRQPVPEWPIPPAQGGPLAAYPPQAPAGARSAGGGSAGAGASSGGGGSAARRVVADERSDHFPEQHAVVLLQEVPGPRDHGMLHARRPGDRAFQDVGHAAGDRVAVAEGDEERPVPG